MKGKEMSIGNFTGTSSRGSSSDKDSPVIATLPRHVKSWLMMMVLSNSLCWIAFGLDWFGFEEGVGVVKAAVSGAAIAWCVVVIPMIMAFTVQIDWGQKGRGG